jgi:two-component system sensor histidine kinase DegS
MSENEAAAELSPLEQFIEDSQARFEKTQREVQEIGLLVEQSQGEIEKLAQRNTNVTARLHQMQAHFDTVPREDIRENYEAALDAQQRLFTMRGQLEKLESDHKHLQDNAAYINRALELLGANPDIEIEEESPQAKGGVMGKIIQAQEEERRKISRQIHDGPAQVLSNFILQTEIAVRLFENNPEKAREELDSLKEAASTSFAKVRDFIFELRPMMLDDLGLVPTVKRYAEAYKDKSGLEINVVSTGQERRLEAHREVILFRVVQAALANTRDHAQATQVKIVIDIDSDNIRVTMEDNGKGFDPEIIHQDEYITHALALVSNQIEELDGSIEIDSKPGEGTRIAVVLPSSDSK